jgi:hypothetical protein
MIVYVATYPRSGSGLLRQVIGWCFDQRCSGSHTGGYKKALPTDDPDVVIAKERQPGMPPQFMIRPEAAENPAPELRQRLAARRELFFVKTHFPPPDEHFEGERAIQMIRHPAAAMHSYGVVFKHAVAAGADPPSQAGDWSAYHSAWRETSMPIERVRYEDNFPEPWDAISAIERLIGRPPVWTTFETPDQARERNPERNPIFGPDHWRTALPVEVADDIWSRHKAEASRYGYDRVGVAGPMTKPQTI